MTSNECAQAARVLLEYLQGTVEKHRTPRGGTRDVTEDSLVAVRLCALTLPVPCFGVPGPGENEWWGGLGGETGGTLCCMFGVGTNHQFLATTVIQRPYVHAQPQMLTYLG